MIWILQGNCREVLKTLPAESVHCVVTSPPYWGLRDYGVDGQMGLEHCLAAHLEALVEVFREVRRVLRKDGTAWVNYGDAYASAPNGRSAADVKAIGNDDRTFRDKTISTVGPILGWSQADEDRNTGKERYRPKTGFRAVAGGTLKPKDRMLLPARVAIALQEDGWWVRDEIVWHKPNPMPSSVKDRTTPAHEMVYMLSKSAQYFYDAAAIRELRVAATAKRPGVFVADVDGEPGKRTVKGNRRIKVPGGWATNPGAHGTINKAGRTSAKYKELDVEAATNSSTARRVDGFNDRWDAVGELLSDGKRNKRSVWTVAPHPFKEAHFATFPPALIEPCIKAGCPAGGTVLDPFFGAGTTALVAQQLGRDCIGIELNPEYIEIARRRLGLSVELESEIAEMLS